MRWYKLHCTSSFLLMITSSFETVMGSKLSLACKWRCAFCGLMLTAIIHCLRAELITPVDTVGWEGLQIKPDSRVAGLETSVDQTASNARQCIRLCWLFSACSSLTYVSNLRRCLLYLTDGGDRYDFRTVSERGSVAVDMGAAKMVSSKVGKDE